MRQLRVWWIIITQMGSAMRISKQIGEIERYCILATLAGEGFFDYLQAPRTYGQILAQFSFADVDYTRRVLDVLASDRRNTLIKEDNHYRANPAHPIPTREEILARVDERFHIFLPLNEGVFRNIPARMRNQPIEYTQSMDESQRKLTEAFDAVLGDRLYTAMRRAAFTLLTRAERAWLRGKTLLDIGCGSGRETADLWLHLGGDAHITAIDPVPGMLALAEQRFEAYLDEVNSKHPPVTEANRPVFRQASGTDLHVFEDNSFDAAFYSQVLHWSADPHKIISEVVRVVKPGGLIFGAQGSKPKASNPYLDLRIRISENSYGFFWVDEYRRWYADHGVELEIVAPPGIFRARVPEQIQ